MLECLNSIVKRRLQWRVAMNSMVVVGCLGYILRSTAAEPLAVAYILPAFAFVVLFALGSHSTKCYGEKAFSETGGVW